MGRKWIAAGALLAACGIGAAGAGVVAGDGSTPFAEVADSEVTVTVGVARQARAAGATTAFVYPTTPSQVIPASDNTSVMFTVRSCPPGSKVVNGQFETNRALTVLETSRPSGRRDWLFRLTDADPAEQGDYTAQFGLVCATNKR